VTPNPLESYNAPRQWEVCTYNENLLCVSDSSCMYRGTSDTEECKLHDAELFGLYIHVTSGCEYL
jgi:hypothetical protein